MIFSRCELSLDKTHTLEVLILISYLIIAKRASVKFSILSDKYAKVHSYNCIEYYAVKYSFQLGILEYIIHPQTRSHSLEQARAHIALLHSMVNNRKSAPAHSVPSHTTSNPIRPTLQCNQSIRYSKPVQIFEPMTQGGEGDMSHILAICCSPLIHM